MGIITDYFLAADDDAAMAAIAPVGGPTVADPESPDVLQCKGVMPSIELAELVALLSGRVFDEVQAALSAGPPVAIIDDGEQVLEKVPADAVTALAAGTAARIDEVALRWMADQFEQFPSPPGQDPRRQLITDLCELARRASPRSNLYCWSCV